MHMAKSQLPTVGEMMERLSNGEFDGKAYDAEYPERVKRTIYWADLPFGNISATHRRHEHTRP